MKNVKNTQIIKYLKKPGSVVALIGAWGTGKSYFWNHTIKPELKAAKKKVFTVSLFGKTSISDIKKEMLNLAIGAAGWMGRLILGALSVIFLTVVLYVFLSQLDFFYSCNNDFDYKIFALSFLCALFVVIKYFSYILKFVGQKVIGFDHNNIDFLQIFNAKETVICFDDFERMNYDGSVRELLGFVQHLSDNGFSVLLILNEKEFEKESEVWNKFKEKVIHKPYPYICDGVLNCMLQEEYVSKTIKKFIILIHRQLNDIKRESFSAEALILIDRFSNNFRFFRKLITELQEIELNAKRFVKLEENTIQGVLYYVLYMVVKQELGELTQKPITTDDLFNFYYRKDLICIDNKETKKGFGNAFSVDFNLSLAVYPNIHKYFIGESFDYNAFLDKDVVMPSKTEQFSNSLGHWMDYSTTEQQDLVSKFETLFQKEKKPFRSLSRMRGVLDKYVVFCSYIRKTLTEENSVVLLDKMALFIKDHKIELNLLEHGTTDLILHREHTADDDFIDNIRFVNQSFAKLLIKYWEKEIIQKSDIISEIIENTEGGAYTKMCLYLFLEDKAAWDRLFAMRKVDYMMWTNAVRVIKNALDEYDDGYGVVKTLNDVRKDNAWLKFEFINSLKTHLNQIVQEPTVGLSEKNFVKNLFPEIL